MSRNTTDVKVQLQLKNLWDYCEKITVLNFEVNKMLKIANFS